ncbi:MAG: dihydrolipoyl dehydrogenase [Opitutales bacterium]|nr:dihydrolipoyl dehydrogenase [Opitutales bacterium]
MEKFDLIIIGGGPAGYVGGIRAAQLGLSVALIEKYPHLGGTCLNVGCIPSKALLHSTELFHQLSHGEKHGILAESVKIDVAKLMERKTGVVDQLRKGVRMLVEKRKIAIHTGTGSLAGKGQVTVTPEKGDAYTIEGKDIVIATGSAPVELPFLKFDGKDIVSSTEALEFTEVPKRLVVVGGGAIGLELGCVWARLGSEVTVVEFLPTIAAGSDEDVSKLAERIFKKQGLKIDTATKVTGASKKDGAWVLEAEKKGKAVTYTADKILVAVGRKAHTGGLGLDKVGIQTDDRGRIPTDHFRTTAEHIWAIGDVITGPMLAHKAEEDGVAVAELIAGKPGHVDYNLVPNVIYTHPEIASVGLTEKMAADQKRDVKIGKFNLMANGRAIAQDATDGMVKVIADAKTDRLLGVAIIAAGASEMIANAVAHMTYGGSAEDLGRTVHAHPTISESLKEAALSISKSAIHGI